MLFEFESGVMLTVSEKPLNTLLGDLECSIGFELESGGILLGSYDAQRNEYRVFDFTRPCLQDERAPAHFIRCRTSANIAIRRAWEKSNGTVNYLGEWHTHNEVRPIPSEVDRELMRRIVKDGDCVFASSFMLIIGSGGEVFCGEVNRGGSGEFSGECWSSWR